MRPTFTRGATHIFEPPKNWQPETDGECGDLQVRVETFGERNIVELFSTWKPNAAEIAHINAGGVIEIGICTATQPVMRARIVDPVEAVLTPYMPPIEEASEHDPKPITINEGAHGDDSHG